MSPTDITQADRELLAAEYREAGLTATAARVLAGPTTADMDYALRAISRLRARAETAEAQRDAALMRLVPDSPITEEDIAWAMGAMSGLRRVEIAEEQSEVDRLSSLLARAVEVLGPFAWQAKFYPEPYSNDYRPTEGETFSVGDLRSASSLLNEIKDNAVGK